MAQADEEKLRNVFQQMDLVDDDKITEQELKNALTNHLGFPPEDAERIAEAIFQDCDTNSDRVLTEEEFVQGILKNW